MSPKALLFLFSLTLAAAMTGRSLAQPADAGQADANTAAAKAEAEGSSTNKSETTETVDEFQPARGGLHHEVIVSLRPVHLRSNETARTVVVIGSDARIDGKVDQALVVIGGDLTLNGSVRQDAVAILGDIHAGKGAKVGDNIVAVGGRVEAADEVSFRNAPIEVDPAGLGKAIRSWFFQCVLKLRPLAPQVGWIWAIWAAFFLVYFLVSLILPVPVT